MPMKFLVTSVILADFFRFLQAVSVNMFLLKLRQIIICEQIFATACNPC